MNTTAQNKFITPLYQTLLIDACKDAQHNLFSAPSHIAWASIKTLKMLILDEKERTPVERHIQQIERKLSIDQIPVGYTFAQKSLTQIKNSDYILRTEAINLYGEILAIFHRNKYLELDTGTNYQNKKTIPIGASLFGTVPQSE